jgi:hypothetical protein
MQIDVEKLSSLAIRQASVYDDSDYERVFLLVRTDTGAEVATVPYGASGDAHAEALAYAIVLAAAPELVRKIKKIAQQAELTPTAPPETMADLVREIEEFARRAIDEMGDDGLVEY